MSPAMKTAALAGLAATAAAFAPMAPAALPAVSAHRCPKDRAASGLRMGFFDFAQSKGDGLTFKEWTHKETLKGPKGAGLGGDIEVLFKIGDEEKPTNAFAGQPLSEVAAQAGAVIPYKCKKGECGTCKVMIDGHWTQACQTKIPALGKGEVFQVNIRETSVKSKKASGFYSAASFRDGFLNNAIGVVGFVKEGIAEEDNFKVRMEREKELLAKVAAKKAAKKA
jgi:ferredoxin